MWSGFRPVAEKNDIRMYDNGKSSASDNGRADRTRAAKNFAFFHIPAVIFL